MGCLSVPPDGWQLQSSENLTAYTRSVRREDGEKRQASRAMDDAGQAYQLPC